MEGFFFFLVLLDGHGRADLNFACVAGAILNEHDVAQYLRQFLDTSLNKRLFFFSRRIISIFGEVTHLNSSSQPFRQFLPDWAFKVFQFSAQLLSAFSRKI